MIARLILDGVRALLSSFAFNDTRWSVVVSLLLGGWLYVLQLNYEESGFREPECSKNQSVSGTE